MASIKDQNSVRVRVSLRHQAPDIIIQSTKDPEVQLNQPGLYLKMRGKKSSPKPFLVRANII